MGVTKMGFEGLLYYGAAGSTAATQITNATDVSVSLDAEKASTSVRGAGSSVPINTEQVVAISFQAEWTMLDKSDDTTLEALKVAAAAGAGVALRMKDYSAGKGYDGDVTLSMKHGKPLKGEQTIVFTATPTDEGGRAPQLYV